MKPKTCPVCKSTFAPQRGFQAACSVPCAIIAGKAREAARAKKVARARLREGRKALMSRSDWMRRAQTQFNKWVLLRDRFHPCIACGKARTGRSHASHFRSVGSNPATRFSELNVHASCAPCNLYLSGNLGPYRVHLEKRIGLHGLKWLEGPHTPLKLTIQEIQSIESTYKQAIRNATTMHETNNTHA